MCVVLESRWTEYSINIIDILSDLYFAYWIVDKCIGWAVTLGLLTAIGFIGFIMKLIAQCYRSEIRDTVTSRRKLYWKKNFETAYFFGVLIELFFEGLCVGIIEAIIVGNDKMSNVSAIGIIIIVIKLIYCLFMSIKYCLVSSEDHFKPWLLIPSLVIMFIIYSIAFCALSDVFNGSKLTDCT